jgi:hypothetical protein
MTSFHGQRMMLPHERAFADPEVMAKIGSRVEDIATWRDLGMDELIVAPPGLHNTDETLYELIEDIRAAGVEFPRPGWGGAGGGGAAGAGPGSAAAGAPPSGA